MIYVGHVCEANTEFFYYHNDTLIVTDKTRTTN